MAGQNSSMNKDAAERGVRRVRTHFVAPDGMHMDSFNGSISGISQDHEGFGYDDFNI